MQLETPSFAADNESMIISGRVHNGVVVPEQGAQLPEGAIVCISLLAEQKVGRKSERVQLPLVPSSRPGSLQLTNQQIAEILDDEDAAS